MPINLPTDPTHAAGDLARAITHEADESWPSMIEVVAYFGPPEHPRKGKNKRVEIPADRFYGRKGYGAPMTGDEIIRMIESLRKGS